MVAPFCQTQPRPPEPLSIWTTSPRRATTVPSAPMTTRAGSTPLAGIAMTSPPTSLPPVATTTTPVGLAVSRFSPTLGGRPAWVSKLSLMPAASSGSGTACDTSATAPVSV